LSTAEIIPAESQALTAQNPMQLMSQAVQRGIPAEQLAIIQEMYFKQLDRDAKTAFLEAKKRFKENAPEIVKTRAVTYEKGPNAKPAYFFAPLEEICPLIIDALNKVDITHRWRSEPPNNPGWVRVVCVITHALGYSEEFGLEAPVDGSGGKNGIQAVISATSYLERVTLLGVCGLAAKGMDNDAGATNEWISERFTEMERTTSIEELRKVFGVAFNEAKKNKAAAAMLALTEKHDALKSKFSKGEGVELDWSKK